MPRGRCENVEDFNALEATLPELRQEASGVRPLFGVARFLGVSSVCSPARVKCAAFNALGQAPPRWWTATASGYATAVVSVNVDGLSAAPYHQDVVTNVGFQRRGVCFEAGSSFPRSSGLRMRRDSRHLRGTQVASRGVMDSSERVDVWLANGKKYSGHIVDVWPGHASSHGSLVLCEDDRVYVLIHRVHVTRIQRVEPVPDGALSPTVV